MGQVGLSRQGGRYANRSVRLSIFLSFNLSVCRVTAKVISRFNCNLVIWLSHKLINSWWWSGHGYEFHFPHYCGIGDFGRFFINILQSHRPIFTTLGDMSDAEVCALWIKYENDFFSFFCFFFSLIFLFDSVSYSSWLRVSFSAHVLHACISYRIGAAVNQLNSAQSSSYRPRIYCT